MKWSPVLMAQIRVMVPHNLLYRVSCGSIPVVWAGVSHYLRVGLEKKTPVFKGTVSVHVNAVFLFFIFFYFNFLCFKFVYS